MKMTGELLKIREKIKSRKPKFRRQQTNQFPKLNKSDSWRKPKGSGSKMRNRMKGHRKMPTVGYGSPRQVRALNRNGSMEVVVSNVDQIRKVDPKSEAAVIGKLVGGRKKIALLEEAKKLKLKVANVADIDNKIKELTKDKESKSDKKSKKKDVSKSVSSEKEEKKDSKKDEESLKDSSKTTQNKETQKGKAQGEQNKNEDKKEGGASK